MNKFITKILLLCLLMISTQILAQQTKQFRVVDKITGEPLSGATIKFEDGSSYVSDEKGSVEISRTTGKAVITMTGYLRYDVNLESLKEQSLRMEQDNVSLEQVVYTANRQVQKRTEAPVAISNISPTVIHETKATSIDQLVNKVSGVFMVNLGNEQHSMSIRQPMSTKSLYLYLEDGIPVRTSGVFNHNALLEMNMATVRNIEVIRGPSSSMYGGEAIGGAINFISAAAPLHPTIRLGIQGNDIGYRRADLSAAFTSGKLGLSFTGYAAENRNGTLQYSDFRKLIGTIKADYQINSTTSWHNTLTKLDYSSDMRGALDSLAFADKNYSTLHSFTFRDVEATRFKSQVNKNWNNASSTSIALIFRNNSIKQNPAYAVKDDYRRVSGQWRGNPGLAHGEINDSYFKSYAILGTHRQTFAHDKLKTVSGVSLDYSPAGYHARYIRIQQDSSSRRYLGYTDVEDSLLSNYSTDLTNVGLFSQLDFAVAGNLHLVAGLRYDVFRMAYDNFLPPSAFSGAPGTTRNFYRFTPKVGFTWMATRSVGFYGNYSEGFVAPQITELFRGVKVPNLQPQTFVNYEAGGWISLLKNVVYADFSIYLLEGSNEIISVRLDDGTSANANAGKTIHKGIEYGITLRPTSELRIRFSGSNSKHRFVDFEEKGVDYKNNEMNNAPGFLYNTEVMYKPSWAKGLRLGVEQQHVSSYWMDPLNTSRYSGFTMFNVRAGYEISGVEFWLNVINAGNTYYATNASKSSFGQSYNIGEPRNFNLGLAYTFVKKSKKSNQ